MTIRPFLGDDLQECARVFVGTYNQAPWNYHWELKNATSYLSEYASSLHFVGFVLSDEQGLAAAMFGHRKTWWSGDLLYVDELFVHPEKQGLRYGKSLIGCAEKYCMENRLSNITLMTNRHMPAYQFYDKLGFVTVDQNALLFKQT
jgi:ribosomal protein S18 acetylase RimI-like enzyme